MGKTLKVKPIKELFEKLLHLKELVENLSRQPDIALRGGVYKEIAIADIMTVKHDNWVIGYKVIPSLISETRRIWIKVEGYKLSEIPDIEANPIMVTIFDVFLDRQQEAPVIIDMFNDAIKIEQVCVPLASSMPIMDNGMRQ
ncbi:MAG: hypothetical protein ACFFB3_06565 [Candidatus Hodarchaeota archaeon]